MLTSLEPQSTYSQPEESKKHQQKMSGYYAGIGAQIDYFNDTLKIIRVVKGGPAYKAGLKSRDCILTLYDKPVNPVDYLFEDVYKIL